MLYVVLMPIKRNRIRSLAIIWANNFRDVQEKLRLPMDWMYWVSFTQKELSKVMGVGLYPLIKLICKETY